MLCLYSMLFFSTLSYTCQNTNIKSSDANSWISLPLKKSILGLVAGATESFFTQPFITAKNIDQIGLAKNTFTIGRLWQGISVASCQMACATGLQTYLHNVLAQKVNNQLTRSFIAGLLSAYLLIGPAELIIAQQHINNRNVTQTIKTIYKDAGLRGFFRGCGFTAGREGLFAAGFLSITPTIEQHLRSTGVHPLVAIVSSSIAAGTLAMTLSHPCNTIKTILATDVTRKKDPFAYNLLKESTFKSLMKGYKQRLVGGTISTTWLAWATKQIDTHVKT